MPEFAVQGRTIIDHSAGLNQIGGVHESNFERHLFLWIRQVDGRYNLRVTSNVPYKYFDAGRLWEADIPYTPDELWGLVQECRRVWHDDAILAKLGLARPPMTSAWDLRPFQTEIQDAVLPKLAEAGLRLFEAIFYPDSSDPALQELAEIGDELRKAIVEPDLVVLIDSQRFYVPWEMMYLGDDPAHPDPRFFWGFQHLLEQSPSTRAPRSELSENRPLKMSVHLDPNIDASTGTRCNTAFRESLDTFDPSDLEVVERPDRDLLRGALDPGPLPDHVVYFCCHGLGGGDTTAMRFDRAALQLPTSKEFTPSDIIAWTRRNRLGSAPLVFVNACGGGQMTSTYYQGFADAFLKSAASAMIGPQTDVPAVFAGEFARRFFERFFGMRRVGEVLLELRRELMDTYANPLGLVYSLYRGADITLHSQIRPKASGGPQP